MLTPSTPRQSAWPSARVLFTTFKLYESRMTFVQSPVKAFQKARPLRQYWVSLDLTFTDLDCHWTWLFMDLTFSWNLGWPLASLDRVDKHTSGPMYSGSNTLRNLRQVDTPRRIHSETEIIFNKLKLSEKTDMENLGQQKLWFKNSTVTTFNCWSQSYV